MNVRFLTLATPIVAIAELVACHVLLEGGSNGARCNGPSCSDTGDAGDASTTEGDAGNDDDATWKCLGGDRPEPKVAPSIAVRYEHHFVRVLDRKPWERLELRACDSFDEYCVQPLAGSATTTDTLGLAVVPLYRGFRGYLDISEPSSDGGLLPSLVVVGPVVDRDGPIPRVALYSAEDFRYALAALHAVAVYVDGSAPSGHLLFKALDCLRQPAADVVVRVNTLTADTFQYYTDADGVPSIAVEATTSAGTGGVLRLPIGRATLSMTKHDGTLIVETEVPIRAGTMTYVTLGPTP
ncbi:MAG TPA: hypothetical protein VM925_04320 [Labilithrix sp.]|nr:hypothetical protein [Labilithrix sp.]